MINKADAILSLNPKSEFVLTDDELKWLSPNIDKPSDDQIDTELKRLQADYDAKKYQRDRAVSYPAIGDQLDMLFHAIDAGALDKNSDFYTTLKAVKDKYPKG